MKLIPRSRPMRFLLTVLGTVVVTFIILNIMPDRRELREPLPHLMTADDPAFLDTMNGLFGANVLGGNRIETLVNGDEIFPQMLAAIAGAQQTVTMETYVYWSGSIAEAFADSLSERAQAGVSVKVMLDWKGSIPFDDALKDRMEAAGVQVVRFRPIRWYTLDRINNRTHRKLLIADGRVGFTGGVGIGDEWLGDARNSDEWRETHYRIEGPSVAMLQAAFAENWIEASNELLQGPEFFPPTEDAGTSAAHLVTSSSGERNTMHLMLMTALAAATDRIRIGTPYFVPDDVAIGQLLEARARGVEVDILVPGPEMNKDFVRYASRHFWGDMLRAGVRFHEYAPTMYHAKLITVDDAWASVGSTNFDERSFRLNDEANLNVFDRDFVQLQNAIFDRDIERARLITLEEWQNRPLLAKTRDWILSWLRAQM